MTLGEKIRHARIANNLTQAKLASGIITRNMLCSIEKGAATPSLSTLTALAKKLNIPMAYFFSDGNDIFMYRKNTEMEKILSALASKNYKSVIERATSLGDYDNEISYILAFSHFELAEESIKNGAIETAKKHLSEYNKYRKNTVYDLSMQNTLEIIYSAIAANIQAPLLELDLNKYEQHVEETVAYEYYKYISMDTTFPYKNQAFRRHIEAKNLIRERRYQDAVNILEDIILSRSADYDAYFIFNVYTDIENCYKQLVDFENAYRYSSKRISLLEGFKS